MGDDPSDRPLLGVVVPTLNEAEYLPALLEDLAELAVAHTLVVADGGSTDTTRDLAKQAGATVIMAHRGRAHQMNAGARVASSDWLLFLHADTRLPVEARECLTRRLRDDATTNPAYFRFSLRDRGWFWRLIELGQRLRERFTGLAYGDQGLLILRRDFDAIGGFPPIPVMEDVALMRVLRSRFQVDRLPARLPISTRRYVEEGRCRAWVRNARLFALFSLRMDPEKLARLYPPRRSTPPEGHVALAFAKAPIPGRVKTRLATGIGAEAAARLYAEIAGDVVDRLSSPSFDLWICYDPPQATAEIQEWLGNEVALIPQEEGDLGARLQAALTAALTVAHKACVLGTDVPGLEAGLVEEAFERLEEVDVVIGPGGDGGYYLLAAKQVFPELFSEIPWSTSRVMECTLTAAESSGLRVHTLVPLDDVDLPEDLESPGMERYRDLFQNPAR